MIAVRPSSVSAIFGADEFDALIEEYAAESAIEGMPPPMTKLMSYVPLEGQNFLHAFAALNGNALVGFISVLAPILPHFSIPVAVAESFFVAAAHRHTMAGLKLLVAAEGKAKEIGSPGLLVCAPEGGKLFHLLPKCGYVASNRIFFKRLNDA